jgi:alkylation response protein AidB-like acyl-CoA dehydrogenase
MRLNALRSNPRTDAINKLYWATLHRSIGELAMDVIGPGSVTAEPDTVEDRLARMFLFSRADTIYGGSNQVQRNIIGERVLGLPKEPK